MGQMRLSAALGCAVVLSVCWGCESRHVGMNQQLVFVYDSPFEHETFNKPLVVGGRLEVSVRALHAQREERALTISSVTSSDPQVLAVTGTVANMFEVEARRPGEVTLTVESVDEDGQRLTDRVTWRTDEMASMTMEHECDVSDVAYMLNDSPSFTIDVERVNARGERLAGSWHAPIEVTPAPAHVRRPVVSQTSVEIIMKGAKGDVHVGAKGSAQRLTMKRVGLNEITGLGTTMAPDDYMLVGEKTWEMIPLLVGEHMVCEPRWSMTLKNKTPAVCEVTQGDEGSRILEGFVSVKALASGECAYTVGVEGHKLSRTFSFPVGRVEFEGADAPSNSTRPTTAPKVPWWVAPLLALCVPGLLAPVWWVLTRRRRANDAS